MKRALLLVTAIFVLPLLLAAEIRASLVTIDRVPWELAEPRLKGGSWWDVPHIPTDHAYWWTLTDETKPAEIKQRIAERIAVARAEAVSQRRSATATSANEPLLRVKLDGQEAPELFPVWKAFYSLAIQLDETKTKEQLVGELVRFGFSPTGAHEVSLIAEETLRRGDQLFREILPDGQQLRSLWLRAEEQIGAEAVEELRSRNDFALLSKHVGWSEEALRELALRADRRYDAEAAVPAIVVIRKQLEDQEWELLRRYLLSEVAAYRSEKIVLELDEQKE